MERWCILLYFHCKWYVDVFLFNTLSGTLVYLIISSSMARRCIYFHTFSGTMVYVIVNGTEVHLFSTSSGTLVAQLQWNIGVSFYFHRQWHVDVCIFSYHQWN